MPSRKMAGRNFMSFFNYSRKSNVLNRLVGFRTNVHYLLVRAAIRIGTAAVFYFPPSLPRMTTTDAAGKS